MLNNPIIHYETVKDTLLKHPKTWLITGVAGFVGSNLLEILLKLNQKVVGLDNFSTGNPKNIDEVLQSIEPTQQKNFTFYKGDIRNLQDCQKATHQVDYILHQAALGSVPRSIATPELTTENNVNGTINMLLAARDADVKRFVYASSSSVYGDSPLLPKVENVVGNPLSPYAASKYANELYAKAFATCYDMETIGLRYFNIFGARQNPEGPYAAVIPLWILSLCKNEPVFINGDGETTRDFCFIENALQANILAATVQNKEAINKSYNVAVGERISLNDLYLTISSYFSNPPPLNYRDFRKGDVRNSLADISLSRELLGYEPQFKVKEGLAKTVDWFCSKVNYQSKSSR